jgi:hypothetical protein
MLWPFGEDELATTATLKHRSGDIFYAVVDTPAVAAALTPAQWQPAHYGKEMGGKPAWVVGIQTQNDQLKWNVVPGAITEFVDAEEYSGDSSTGNSFHFCKIEMKLQHALSITGMAGCAILDRSGGCLGMATSFGRNLDVVAFTPSEEIVRSAQTFLPGYKVAMGEPMRNSLANSARPNACTK